MWSAKKKYKHRISRFNDYLVDGTSLVVQRLILCTTTAGGAGWIPGQGSKFPHALWHDKETNK